MPTLQLTVAGQDLRAELTASAPARDLVQQPLTLSFRDFGGQEKVAPLPQPLSMTGVPARSGAQAGDLGYYQPDNVRSRDARDYSFVDWIFGPTALTPDEERAMFQPIPLEQVPTPA
ncbi:cyclophilin-like fold protein [Arsenicicoccus piscis]|uniref:Cyclophilin-like domain-containing protein n=1 Tax=Arsenicicoccus piscis TaxID=673954 RepID=A0ABQ6HTD5_9MICO|nr:cyclophilin-like fold protein [Arsenicicoccus piscis]MCH8627506.1 cyclophilin-like fold protein [Arsenicicoccus piscis]GMA21681.1 hypothetical protein GCM10025862_37020 [Arsenicicoccus piscis]